MQHLSYERMNACEHASMLLWLQANMQRLSYERMNACEHASMLLWLQANMQRLSYERMNACEHAFMQPITLWPCPMDGHASMGTLSATAYPSGPRWRARR
jgi:hypothetical protein